MLKFRDCFVHCYDIDPLSTWYFYLRTPNSRLIKMANEAMSMNRRKDQSKNMRSKAAEAA